MSRSKLYEKIKEYIKEYDMLKPQSGVVVGVSGGADSVCLLYVLTLIRQEYSERFGLGIDESLRIKAVHVNHMIRGVEAERDEGFVEELCKKLDVEFVAYHKDIPKMAREEHLSEEEAGRIYRYKCFEDEACRLEAELSGRRAEEAKLVSRQAEVAGIEASGSTAVVKIAVAHNKDDLAETVLYNMIRGSSMMGLAGIKPVRGRIIRPLLDIERSDIEKILQDAGLVFITDSTNLVPEYSRNKIRLEIMPLLKEINSGTVKHMAEIAEDARRLAEDTDKEIIRAYNQRDDAIISEGQNANNIKAENKIAENIKNENSKTESKKAENVNAKNVKTENVKAENSNVCDINIERLTGLSHLSRGEVILRAIEKACGRRKDITREHIASVEALASNISGSRVDLPYGLVAERVYDRIVVYDASSVDSMDGVSGKLRLDTFPYENRMIISKNEYTKMIDCDRIKSVPVLRTPEEGDFIVINKDGGRKKLSRFLTDCKVERMKRATIPVVADGNEIIWVVGHRLSERYKITENTKTVMELSIDKEDRT